MVKFLSTSLISEFLKLQSNYELDNFLKKHESEILLEDISGWNLAFYACEVGWANVLRRLISINNQIIFHRDKESNTALHWATYFMNCECIQVLMANGADINVVNLAGDTPLHIAVLNSVKFIDEKVEPSLSVVRLLLQFCANCKLKNCWGQMATTIALQNRRIADVIIDHHKFVQYLEKRESLSKDSIITSDISYGFENMPIPLINETKFPSPLIPEFTYTTECLALEDVRQEDIKRYVTCSCKDDCLSGRCDCALLGTVTYSSDRFLKPPFNGGPESILCECSALCSCSSSCSNNLIQRGLQYPLEVYYRGPDIGWGVRTAAPILEGAFIGQYTGVILKEAESYNVVDDSYLFDIPNTNNSQFQYQLDAKNFGNITRFFNHSCKANLIAISIVTGRNDEFARLGFFSTQFIPQGSELTFDYGMQFWRVKMSSISCKCEEENCRYNGDVIEIDDFSNNEID